MTGAALFLSAASLSVCASPQSKTPAATTPPQKSAAAAKAPAKSSGKKPASKKKGASRSARRQTAPTADRIKEIQSALAGKGFYSGQPTGKWDAASIQAMKDFQNANGLKANGKLGALSLQKLGLGSEVAGIAAPRQQAGGATPPQR